LVEEVAWPRASDSFEPLAESRQWEFAAGYYEEAGPHAFLGGAVPHAVTSDGSLSIDAAELLFATVECSGEAGGPIRCLEIGPGTGLFSKLLLDRFEQLCRERQRDHYARLQLVLADVSGSMLQAISASGLLSRHTGHYELVHRAAAELPLRQEGPYQAVFVNYLLDQLPATVLRGREEGLEQLCVRTHGGPLQAPRLEWRYEPVVEDELPELGWLEALLPLPAGVVEVHSHGAVALLRRVRGTLSRDGFMLVNDFGWTRGSQEPGSPPPQRAYGGAVAVAVNLRQIEHQAAAWGLSVHAPPGGDGPLATRLITGPGLDPRVSACFAERFATARRQAQLDRLEHVRKLARDGGADADWSALERSLDEEPSNWILLAKAAAVTAYVRRDYEVAQALAQRGLELNPIAPELWNVLGDCALHQREVDRALVYFERAVAIDPREVRARLNIAFGLMVTRRYQEALTVIDEALALDDGRLARRLQAQRERICQRLRDGPGSRPEARG
jgi:hypothetical protein